MNETRGLLHGFVLTVARVAMQVSFQAPLMDQYEAEYRPFVSSVVPPGLQPAVRVSVLSARSPLNNSPVIFDTGSAWSMQPEGKGYRLSFHAGEIRVCHTVACSNADTTAVSVYVDQDLEPEREGGKQTNPLRYPLDQLLLMNHLSSRGGVVLHAAGAVVGGQALIFLGASGAGKSTLSKLFVDAGFASDLLSDDRVIARFSPGATGTAMCEVWGTPWPGDAEIAANACAPLGALFFLVKAEANEIVPLPVSLAMKRLMPVASCPWYDPERMPGVLDTCARIVENHPCFDLRFRPEEDVVSLLSGGSYSRVCEHGAVRLAGGPPPLAVRKSSSVLDLPGKGDDRNE